jgi:hypothetical protein
MSKNLHDTVTESQASLLKSVYGPADNAEKLSEYAAKFKRTESMLSELMQTGTRAKHNVPALDLSEAVHTADFKILFPKVVQDKLQRPQEPTYIGQSLLARTIQVDGAKIMEFPTLGAIRAFELADTQEPPEQDPAFSRNITEIRVRRFGLKLEMTNEVIEESQWDVLSLYTEAAGAAMMRLKEELIFREYEANALPLYDNTSTDATRQTTGVGADGSTKNGTFDHMDLLDMMAAMAANGYNPTDVVLHPMSWAIWAKDPYLRYQILHQGGIGQTVGNFNGNTANMNANVYVPFGLNVVVTPFQTVSFNTTLSTGITSPGAGNYTTISLVDRNSSILVLQRTPMSLVEFENPMRDIRTLMFHEKYGLALLNGGRSAVTAKNVRIDLNQKPVFSYRTVSA